VRERQGLVGRIWQVRRGPADADRAPSASPADSRHDEIRALETRIAHLEHLVHGLQDSVHRETTRLGERIDEIEARIQPAALGRALSDDARDRGL
jgi:hypothetical protein